ncbi:MAG: phosphate ABC transporter permease PstA [Armatimonadetes bacterium]|nr:phosphate ABC transporter permease PstA [Armatimonadota bacterium]
MPLVLVLAYVGAEGLRGLSWSFFTELPAPVGEVGGGMANALLGTLLLVGVACLLSLPVGLLAGIYLSEFGHGSRLASAARFAADVLSGVPSILIGLFVYTLVVVPMRGFSALSGAVALGVLMIPIVMRGTEEVLRLVPDSLREAALGLGVPRWRAILGVVMPSAGPGIVTAVMLAVARAAGETAPLLFTAFGNRDWSAGLDQPIAALPLQIYTYAISPYEDWHRQAWAASLVLVGLVLILNLGARFMVRRRR